MKAQTARDLGQRIAALVQAGRMSAACALLAPVLAERTPFPILGYLGKAIGAGPLEAVNRFLDRVAAARTEGGWVVIGSALGQQSERDLAGAFSRCHGFIIAGDVWYATDILGERVPGPALVSHWLPALDRLAPWCQDANRWVRRTVGVAVHFWAKRSRGAPEYASQAQELLDLLDPMFEEKDEDAVKGIGWGLKTLGKYYPDELTDWLAHQVIHLQRQPRALMLRKALTYLPARQRVRVTGGGSP